MTSGDSNVLVFHDFNANFGPSKKKWTISQSAVFLHSTGNVSCLQLSDCVWVFVTETVITVANFRLTWHCNWLGFWRMFYSVNSTGVWGRSAYQLHTIWAFLGFCTTIAPLKIPSTLRFQTTFENPYNFFSNHGQPLTGQPICFILPKFFSTCSYCKCSSNTI